MNAPSTVARLACDETNARRIAAYLAEILEAEEAACAAFEGDDGGWQVAVHFRNAPNEARLRGLVEFVAGGAAAHALCIEPVAAADWVAQSLAGLKPVHAGRFVVHGAHDRALLKANSIGIEIEAALAFGTGHHGTTRGCLLALDDLAKRRKPQRVLDIGTGSGVLAIAAARRWRTQIVASDNDPIAVQAARSNARLNCVASTIAFARATSTHSRTIVSRSPYQLIFANILLAPLMRLAVPLRKLCAPGSRIVLSGLLAGHATAILAIYRTQGFALERRIALGGWVTLIMRRASVRKRSAQANV